VGEVGTLVQQGLAAVSAQGVGEAIAEIEPGGMTAALAEIPVGPASYLCMPRRDRFDLQAGCGDQISSRPRHRLRPHRVGYRPAMPVGRSCRQHSVSARSKSRMGTRRDALAHAMAQAAPTGTMMRFRIHGHDQGGGAHSTRVAQGREPGEGALPFRGGMADMTIPMPPSAP